MTNQLNGIVTQLTKLLLKHSIMDAKANSPTTTINIIIMYSFHVLFLWSSLLFRVFKGIFLTQKDDKQHKVKERKV
jgi:hypothetical protein